MENELLLDEIRNLKQTMTCLLATIAILQLLSVPLVLPSPEQSRSLDMRTPEGKQMVGDLVSTFGTLFVEVRKQIAPGAEGSKPPNWLM